MTASLSKHLRTAAVAAFLVSLCLGFFLPVYTDEVGWRFQERAGLDGIDKMFSDTCGENTLAVPPVFMWPARYYSAAFNTAFADPLFVRISGILYALVWAFLLLRLIGRVSVTDAQRHTLTIIAFGLMSLGVMPLLLVWSRPEQPIILAVTAALSIWWKGHAESGDTSTGTAWLRGGGILALSAVAFSYHPKAMILAPVFALCMIAGVRGRLATPARAVSVVLLLAMVVVAAVYWSGRVQCPDDPILNAMYARQNLGVHLFKDSGLSGALEALFKNLQINKYVKLAAPAVDPMSQWLPAEQIGKGAQSLWRAVLTIAWVIVLLPSLAAFGIGARDAFRRRMFDGRTLMVMTLVGCTLAWCASQIIQNVYEASFVLPLLMLAFVLALSSLRPEQRLHRGVSIVALALGALALGSQLMVVTIYGPSLMQAATHEMDLLPGQPHSIPVLGYTAAKADIVGAAAQCGIGQDRPLKNLLLDEVTYFTFMTSERPQFRLGVFGLWKGSISDPIAYLRNRGSDGIIVACRSLPPDLAAKAARQAGFCCLGPGNW